MDKVTLLPCPNPWCEGVEGVEASRHIVSDKWNVCCDDCMIEGPWADTYDLAIAAWNTRATPAPDSEKLREAVNALDWTQVYKAARKRVLNDATMSGYDEHLAREIAERLTAALGASA